MPSNYIKVTSPLDGDAPKFVLQNLNGSERISGLFSYNLSLACGDPAVDFSQIVGKNLTVSIEFEFNDKKRYIHGLVRNFRQSGGGDSDTTMYQAELAPWLWKLTLTRDSKVFQNKKIPDIITGIFDDLGYSDYKNSTSGTYAEEEYRVQYQESAFDFVSRLMEEAGIFYYFEHTDSAHTLVLADDSTTLTACPGLDAAKVRKAARDSRDEDEVAAISLEEQIVPNKITIAAFNFEAPAKAVVASAESKTNDLEIYQYPGTFAQKNDGDALAKQRIKIYEAAKESISGHGFIRAFIAGYSFALKEHGKDAVNTDYVLTQLSISADYEQYSNSFEAILKNTPFRPALFTPRPVIYGAQTALVTGAKDDEIHTDKYGRVRVQFHWDRDGQKDEKSSCWVRVAQVWAGKGWGTLFTPRVGSEVVVSFLDGNPDQPLVTGTLYNGAQTLPYKLPDKMNRSTIMSRSTKKGTAGNEICFEDTKDSEDFYMHAQKDMHVEIENDQIIHVKNNRQVFVTTDDPATDKNVKDLLEVKGDRKITVKDDKSKETHTNEGEFVHEVGKNYTLTVKGDTATIEAKGDLIIKGKSVLIQSTEKDCTIKSAADLTLKSAKNATVDGGMDIAVKAAGELTNKSGKDVIITAGMNLTAKASMKLTNKAGAGMELDGGPQLSAKSSAMTEIKSGGIVALKGAMVKAN